jgi:hypothetical protein
MGILRAATHELHATANGWHTLADAGLVVSAQCRGGHGDPRRSGDGERCSHRKDAVQVWQQAIGMD